MGLKDLGRHYSTWERPSVPTFHGFRVWECPPNGQGVAALIALNILKRFDIQGAERWHVMVEAMRLAFEDARW